MTTRKPRVRYGILDDFGDIVRWQWSKPTKSYRYITERIKRVPFDYTEQALF